MAVSVTQIEHWEVYVSQEPWKILGSWTAAPDILPVVARRCLWPSISFTKFEYHVGNFVKHFAGLSAGVKSPVSRMRWFIRLRLFNAANDLLDDWIGIISRTDLERVLGGTTNPTGNLSFTAFGVEAELQQITIRDTKLHSSNATVDDDDFITIDRCIGFNIDPIDGQAVRGNRYTGALWMFSRQPNQDVPDTLNKTMEWDVPEAIKYTLRHDASVYVADGATLPANTLQWRMEEQAGVFSSLPENPSVERDSRTVADVLNDLVPKKSGIAVKVKFENPSPSPWVNQDRLVFVLEYFSTASSSIAVGGITIPAAPTIETLDLRSLKDVAEYSMSESAYEKFDQVVCFGAFATTTFTDKVSNLKPAWETAIETDYLNPDVSSVASDGEKQQLADRLRGQKKFEELFRSWIYSDQISNSPVDNEFWSLVPSHLDTTNLTDLTDIPAIYDDGSLDYREDNYSSKELMPDMRWVVERFGTKKNQPMVFVPIDRQPATGAINYTTSKWAEGSTLAESGGWFSQRQWTLRITTGRSVASSNQTNIPYRVGPSITLDVSGSSQLMIAKTKAATATHLTPQNDPKNEKNLGVDYTDLIFTACYETDFRPLYEYPPAPTAPSGAPLRRKHIQVPWLRFDVMLPKTVVGVSATGTLQYDTNGSFIRDDRDQLRNYAAAAWQIYSLARRPFSLTVQVMTFGNLKPGVLVSTVQTAAGTDNANVIVSQVEFDFRNFTTKFTTEFEEVDVQQIFFAASQRPPRL